MIIVKEYQDGKIATFNTQDLGSRNPYIWMKKIVDWVGEGFQGSVTFWEIRPNRLQLLYFVVGALYQKEVFNCIIGGNLEAPKEILEHVYGKAD